MIGAGILAKRAVERGLNVKPYIKTSLSPGSGVVSKYLEISGLIPYLEKLGFTLAGYGCMTCIGNSGDLPDEVTEAITKDDLVSASVLSGNRNFEGRVHNLIKANYLASPPLVVAYALSGNVKIDFENEPIGTDSEGKPVFLHELWPNKKEVSDIINTYITPKLFSEVYSKITDGTDNWNSLEVNDSLLYEWDNSSTYIKKPPFFEDMYKSFNPSFNSINGARCLLYFGDSITTDHISPAGNISKNSSAAKYLNEKGIINKDFNSYGSRRGNYEVMARGTFANVRLINKLVGEPGPKTLHFPDKAQNDIFTISHQYQNEGTPLIVIAGKEYGSGSSRDWAAK
jgi:aconitate hydratase